MSFDWSHMPEILAQRRLDAVVELIRARNEASSMFYRGKIDALDALARMPADAEEDRQYRQTQGRDEE